MALIAKELKSGKIGKIAVAKDSGKIGHATISSNKNELARLQKNNEPLQAKAPHFAPQSEKISLGKADEKSYSVKANDDIIPQT
ncbi:hypothetical protein, partial [Campylobacter gastrosuis]|uniref:hypothetical protein n=1 Tax=Campylobacter gastrosuis TaxID=2974576 RepID=UPI0032C249BB